MALPRRSYRRKALPGLADGGGDEGLGSQPDRGRHSATDRRARDRCRSRLRCVGREARFVRTVDGALQTKTRRVSCNRRGAELVSDAERALSLRQSEVGAEWTGAGADRASSSGYRWHTGCVPRHRRRGAMAETKGAGGVVYRKVEAEYFEKRGFRRYAGVWSLWALGVGAVISGHYSGWNLGLASVAGAACSSPASSSSIMYLGLVFCIAEMAPALPHTGGAYSFARSAMGRGAALSPALRERRIRADAGGDRVLHRHVYGRHLRDAGDFPARMVDRWLYAVFVGLNVVGVELSFKVTVIVTLLGARDPAHLLRQRLPVLRLRQMGDEHRADATAPGAARRSWSVPAVRHSWRARHAALRGVAVPRHRAAAARGGGVDRSRSATCRRASCSACSR